jgi:S-formylglutathione hydrolase FrmB
MIREVLDASVIAGVVPLIVEILALSGLCVLLAHQGRPWWRRTVPAVVCAAGVAVAIIGWLVDSVWRPFPDPLPVRVLIWLAVAMFGLGLAAANWHPSLRVGRARRVLVLPAVALVVLLPAMKINAFYGYYPAMRDVLGIQSAEEVDFAQVERPRPVELAAPGRALAETWRPPPGLPPRGVVTTVTIPGAVSGFRARPASIYLPPAYLSARRPTLPVLVLIAGQPGTPQDWLTAGKVPAIVDAFARAHAGLAPIVVMPDATGSRLGNPMCLDSRLGQAETYLAHDVPSWTSEHLQVDPDRRHWAIAGFSYGGTCSLQLAVRAPATYPNFLDISGQQEPTLGSHAETVRAAVDGDESAFRAVNPLDVMAARQFPDTFGIIAVGDRDRDYGPQADRITQATRRAGMQIQPLRVPGMHSWAVATTALQQSLPILSVRLGLLPPS